MSGKKHPQRSLDFRKIPNSRSAATTVREPISLEICGIRVDLPTAVNLITTNNIKINNVPLSSAINLEGLGTIIDGLIKR